MPKKTRLDVALVERGCVESREKAQRLIMAGKVLLNDRPALKGSSQVNTEDILKIVAPEKFVSRGGWKLEAALNEFQISCKDKICLDIGASTGGFTDCLLQHGAGHVFAIDVGKNQIASKLRNDSRVTIFDKTNARYLKPSLISSRVELIVIDVSFISVCKILPAAIECAAAKADFVVLIKPQFEAGRELVERGGVVRDSAVHQAVIKKVEDFVEKTLNMAWQNVMESPLRGPAGNKEFLAWFRLISC